MANSFTNINDTLIMEKAVSALNHALTRQDVFTIDVGSDPASQNQTIYVPLATARTGGAFSSTYEDGNTTIAGQSVDVNTHLHCAWYIDDKQAAQSPTKLFEAGAVEAAYGLAATIQNTILNVVTDTNFGNTANTDERVVTAANFDVDEFAEIRNICVKTNQWREVRPGLMGSVLLDGAYCTSLLKDPAIRDMSARGNMNAIDKGMVGHLYGFDVYENNLIASSTPGSTQNLVGFFCQPAAIAAAIRPLRVSQSTVQLDYEDIAVDPDSGAAMHYARWYKPSTGETWGNFRVLMGVDKVDGNRLVKIVSA